MKVYALYDVYFDGGDAWENIVDLYLSHEDAMQACDALIHANAEAGQSYDVREMAVK